MVLSTSIRAVQIFFGCDARGERNLSPLEHDLTTSGITCDTGQSLMVIVTSTVLFNVFLHGRLLLGVLLVHHLVCHNKVFKKKVQNEIRIRIPFFVSFTANNANESSSSSSSCITTYVPKRSS